MDILDLWGHDRLDDVPKGIGETGLAPNSPDNRRKTRKSMTDTARRLHPALMTGRADRRLPLHLAPWLAVAAMAAAALWPRGKRSNGANGSAAPRRLTPAELDAAEPGRGRCARVWWRIPLLGWKDILWRTYREMGRDRLPALAGGVTFYILLATFPALAAFVS